MILFVSETCHHCQRLEAELQKAGIEMRLSENDVIQGNKELSTDAYGSIRGGESSAVDTVGRVFGKPTQIQTIDITQSPENLAMYIDEATAVGYKNGGVPLLIDGQTYIEGTDPILSHLGLLTSNETEATTLTKEDSMMIKEIAGEEKTNPSIFVFTIIFLIALVAILLKFRTKLR